MVYSDLSAIGTLSLASVEGVGQPLAERGYRILMIHPILRGSEIQRTLTLVTITKRSMELH